MRYSLVYDPEYKIIRGCVEEELPLELVNEMAKDLAEYATRYNCRKLLNDLRKAHITRSTFDIYEMPRIVKDGKVPPAIQIALVINAANEDFSFLETVSVNTGKNVKIFLSIDEALAWLIK